MNRLSAVFRTPTVSMLLLTLLVGTAGAQKPGEWTSLFDGKTLDGWKKTDFAGGGASRVEKSFREEGPAIIVEAGSSLSGITWAGATKDAKEPTEPKKPAEFVLPKTNYEISLEAMKIQGGDFFCGLTFPVAESHATLILGGWGGSIVGISSIDSLDASENSTTKFMSFPKDRWFKVRIRVTQEKLEAWLDDKQIVEADIKGKKIGLRFGDISRSVPLGLATYQTSAAYRNIKLRRIDPTVPEKPSEKPPF